MKNYFFVVLFALSTLKLTAQQPQASTLATRTAFQEDKFGLFIHWGVFSILGNGEWVMNNEKINIYNYTRLKQEF